MPGRPASPCTVPRCPGFQPCPQHARVPWSHNANRSASTRGYGPAWRKLCAEVIAEEPFCRICLQQGRLTPTSDVDHIVPKARGGSDARSNLRGLCGTCHRRVTGQQGQAGRGGQSKKFGAFVSGTGGAPTRAWPRKMEKRMNGGDG